MHRCLLPSPPLRLLIKTLAVLAIVFSVCPVVAEDTPPVEKPVFEEWVVVTINGQTSGYGSTITTKVETPSGSGFLTAHHEEFLVKRAGTDMKISETSKVTEDADGGVLSFEQVTTAGSEVKMSGVREGDEMVVSSRGQTQRYKLPRLDALGPEAIRRQTNAVKLAPGEKYSFHTFSTDYPKAVAIEGGSVVGREERDIRGTKRSVWKLTNEISFLPGVTSTLWVDDHNQNVEALTIAPGIGDVHEYVATRAECMKQPHGAEIFEQAAIIPDKAIPSPDELGAVTYKFVTADPSEKLTFWDGDGQHVVSSAAGATEVEVTAPGFIAADADWKLPHADTPELHPFLQASPYLEVNSPDIQRLAKEAVGKQTNPVLAAYRIERFVRRYITKKDLNVGFGSAEETAKSREGDCTEHAVLCAALGRAAGLPTRCVVGLGYIPPGIDSPTVLKRDESKTGEFQFHMWAEAWVGPDKWVPMDAAMDGFDVGHIVVNKPALAELNPILDVNTPIFELMKNLKIEVVKTVPRTLIPVHEPPIAPEPAPPVKAVPATPEPPKPVASKPVPAPVAAPAPEPPPAPKSEPGPAEKPAPQPSPAPKEPQPAVLPGVD